MEHKFLQYTKEEKLGNGGFAEVYRVRNNEGQLFALKEYHPMQHIVDAVGEESLVKRFLREVRHQSDISHPNVVQIIDSDLNATPPYFIMELADKTLQDELAVDHTLSGSPKEALFDVLAGLEALHELDIVHRDLKPANILKVREKGSFRYAISDFGLITAANSNSSNLTDSGQGGGTELYAAPELMHNFKRATPQSDIYSFGAILHDIFSSKKRVPYTELTADGKIGQVIEKCTKKQPRRRYSSISELREDLYEALSDTNITFHSTDEENIISILSDKVNLTDDEWDEFFDLIDQNNDNSISNGNLFRAISNAHIEILVSTAPELFSSLGRDYCEYVQCGSFNFDYCDVLADKIQAFYDHGGIELKALSTLALMIMGADHNRWYVENKFMRMADLTIPQNLADRIRIEIKAQEIDLERYISHIERSINANRITLHQSIFN